MTDNPDWKSHKQQNAIQNITDAHQHASEAIGEARSRPAPAAIAARLHQLADDCDRDFSHLLAQARSGSQDQIVAIDDYTGEYVGGPIAAMNEASSLEASILNELGRLSKHDSECHLDAAATLPDSEQATHRLSLEMPLSDPAIGWYVSYAAFTVLFRLLAERLLNTGAEAKHEISIAGSDMAGQSAAWTVVASLDGAGGISLSAPQPAG